MAVTEMLLRGRKGIPNINGDDKCVQSLFLSYTEIFLLLNKAQEEVEKLTHKQRVKSFNEALGKYGLLSQTVC